jgi:integration host factor subunit beta
MYKDAVEPSSSLNQHGGEGMNTVTKRDISERVARKTGIPQAQVKEAVQALFDEIVEELIQGERLEFRNFGVFEVVERKARTGRNPKTGERVPVPAKKVVNFRMGKYMKDRIATNAKLPHPAQHPQPQGAVR